MQSCSAAAPRQKLICMIPCWASRHANIIFKKPEGCGSLHCERCNTRALPLRVGGPKSYFIFEIAAAPTSHCVIYEHTKCVLTYLKLIAIGLTLLHWPGSGLFLMERSLPKTAYMILQSYAGRFLFLSVYVRHLPKEHPGFFFSCQP